MFRKRSTPGKPYPSREDSGKRIGGDPHTSILLLPRARKLRGLGAGRGIVGQLQGCVAYSRGAGGESQRDGALRPCSQRSSARSASLGEIACVDAGDGDAGDRQRHLLIIRHGFSLRLAGGSHRLSAKVQRPGAQCYRQLPRTLQADGLRTIAGTVGNIYRSRLRAGSFWSECHRDRALRSRSYARSTSVHLAEGRTGDRNINICQADGLIVRQSHGRCGGARSDQYIAERQTRRRQSDRSQARPSEADGLRTIVGIVGNIQRGSAGPGGAGCKADIDRAGSTRRDASAARVRLTKISAIRTGEANVADVQCRALTVGQGDSLRRTGCANDLRSKSQATGRHRNSAAA
jgi:hypothetical protein